MLRISTGRTKRLAEEGGRQRTPRTTLQMSGVLPKRQFDKRYRSVSEEQDKVAAAFPSMNSRTDRLPRERQKKLTRQEKQQILAATTLPPHWMTENIPLDLIEVQRIVGLSKMHVYTLMKRMQFPRPFKVSIRRVRWWSQDVVSYLNGKREGWTEREEVIPTVKPAESDNA
jgi:predicted DNA-binding transcriptional regulator AlpA